MPLKVWRHTQRKVIFNWTLATEAEFCHPNMVGFWGEVREGRVRRGGEGGRERQVAAYSQGVWWRLCQGRAPAAEQTNGGVLLQAPCRVAVLPYMRDTCCHAVFLFGIKTVIVYCVLSYENYNTRKHMLHALTGIVTVGVRVLHEPIALRSDLRGISDEDSRAFFSRNTPSAGGNNIDFLWDRNDVTGN